MVIYVFINFNLLAFCGFRNCKHIFKVLITNDIDDKWYECELRGRRGLVPKNYLQFTNQFHVIQYGEARVSLVAKSSR